jgi:hypothetical protein
MTAPLRAYQSFVQTEADSGRNARSGGTVSTMLNHVHLKRRALRPSSSDRVPDHRPHQKLARFRRCFGRIVAMVDPDDLDFLAEHRAAEIIDSHLRRRRRVPAADCRIDSRFIVDDGDLDRVARLRPDGSTGRRNRGGERAKERAAAVME